MNVLFHYAAGPDLATRLAGIPDLRITACPEDDDALLARLLPESDVIWHVLKRCTAEMIAAAPRLRLIQKIGVGVNTIDLDAAKARENCGLQPPRHQCARGGGTDACADAGRAATTAALRCGDAER